VKTAARHTSVKTRIVAHQQQVVRIDRETRDALDDKATAKLLAAVKTKLPRPTPSSSAITARAWSRSRC
jgi:bifunctional ADP-heptose synthase (sugar kinase/adenylyltransferase)